MATCSWQVQIPMLIGWIGLVAEEAVVEVVLFVVLIHDGTLLVERDLIEVEAESKLCGIRQEDGHERSRGCGSIPLFPDEQALEHIQPCTLWSGYFRTWHK